MATCCGEVIWVENVAGKGYNFCRGCKNEVVDKPAFSDTLGIGNNQIGISVSRLLTDSATHVYIDTTLIFKACLTKANPVTRWSLSMPLLIKKGESVHVGFQSIVFNEDAEITLKGTTEVDLYTIEESVMVSYIDSWGNPCVQLLQGIRTKRG